MSLFLNKTQTLSFPHFNLLLISHVGLNFEALLQFKIVRGDVFLMLNLIIMVVVIVVVVVVVVIVVVFDPT